MKKLILFLFVSIVQNSFGQCVDLTVKEHFSGSPLFKLNKGDIIEICEESKTISFGTLDMYIMKKLLYGQTFVYEFKMDNVYYSPKYGEIQINTQTKKFGISLITGDQGAWTYYNEADMQKKILVEETKTDQAIGFKSFSKGDNIVLQGVYDCLSVKIEGEDSPNSIPLNGFNFNNNNVSYSNNKGFQVVSFVNVLTKNKKSSGLFSNNNDVILGEFELTSSELVLHYKENDKVLLTSVFTLTKKIDEQKVQNDLRTIEKIKKLILDGLLEEAASEYGKLNFENLDLKLEIQQKINSTSFIDTKLMPKNFIDKIINDNYSSFVNLKDGKYTVNLSNTGKLNIVDSTQLNPKQICINKGYLIKDGFEFPINYEGQIIISTEQSKNSIKDSIRFIFAEKFKKKNLYISTKGDYYIGKYGAPLSAEIVQSQQLTSSEVEKNVVVIEKLYQVQKKANDITISQSKIWRKAETLPLKSGIGRKIFRTITTPILFGILLFYN